MTFSLFYYLIRNVMTLVAAYLVSLLALCLRNEAKTVRQTWVSVKGMCSWIERCLDFPSNGGPSLSTLSFPGSLSSLCICSTLSSPFFVLVLRSGPADILSSSVLFTWSSKCSREMQIMLQSAGRADMDTSGRVESSRSAACVPIPCSPPSPKEFGKFGEKLTSHRCFQMSFKTHLCCVRFAKTPENYLTFYMHNMCLKCAVKMQSLHFPLYV